MRFARFVSPTLVPFPLLPLLPLLAIAAATGCSDPPPPVPEGAWSINFQPLEDFTSCSIQQHVIGVGMVSDIKQTKLVADATSGAAVSCSVTGDSKFEVRAEASQMGTKLQLSVDNLVKSATPDAPVLGTLSYVSSTTGKPYITDRDSPCQFYFVPNSGEAVAPGSVWVAFKCPKLIENGGMSTCQITDGYASFKNCTGLSTSM
jgi:hypothetical protein